MATTQQAQDWWRRGLGLRTVALAAGFQHEQLFRDPRFFDWAEANSTDWKLRALAGAGMGDLAEAFDAGLSGHPLPAPIEADRYGRIPEDGISWNFREGKREHGLSVARLAGEDYEWGATLGGLMGGIGVQDRPLVRIRGLRLPWRGSDGEPLLCGAEEIR